jgi:AraC-like DNA-binding protein
MHHDFQPFQSTLTSQGLEKYALKLVRALPCAPLRTSVYCYLQISISQASPYPVMPDGTQALYFSTQGVLLGGGFDQAQTMQLMAPGDYFGVWFYPAGLRGFFSLDLADIQNQLVDESFIPCAQFQTLQGAVYEQDDFLSRVAICDAWLIRRFSPVRQTKFDHALSLILKERGRARVQQVSDQVGWSSRHLNRLFLQHTGLSTKSFSQIIRFQNACKALALNDHTSLDIALDSGYFDQAHFIHSVKKHLGQSA